jgi:serine protease Do
MRAVLWSTLLVRVLAVALGIAGATPVLAAEPALWTEEAHPQAAPELARFNELLSQLADRLKPALVQVRVGRAGSSASSEKPDPPSEARRGTGSGFFIHDSGLLVTNAHVVEGGDSIQIRLASGRRYAGHLVGKDNRVDLALVKIDGAAGIPVLPLGDSNQVRVGEFVLALGHPFGLEQTVSFGIVSRMGSPLTIAAPGFDFIQTDAAVNPGNSGGPLVNMAGEVVGVNSMAARNGSIGFAIPSNLVKLLAPQLMAKGKIEWGWLGVSIGEVGDDELDKLKLAEPRGVVIRDVVPGQPAAQSGLRANDVVIAVDGTPMEGPKDLQRMVAATPVGARLSLSILRDGKPEEVEVTVGPYRESPVERIER